MVENQENPDCKKHIIFVDEFLSSYPENFEKNLVKIDLDDCIIMTIEEILRSYKITGYLKSAIKGVIKNRNKLERIVLGNNILDLSELLGRNGKYLPSDIPTGAVVKYVPPSELPSGPGWRTLGMYDSLTDTIYIANNLSHNVERFVYYHEIAHSLGIKDETQADNYATSKTGYGLAA